MPALIVTTRQDAWFDSRHDLRVFVAARPGAPVDGRGERPPTGGGEASDIADAGDGYGGGGPGRGCSYEPEENPLCLL